MLHSQLITSDTGGGILTSPLSPPELNRSLAASRVASVTEHKYVIPSLVLAFSNDPAVRWLFPDPHQYLTYFPQFVIAFAGKAFEQGTAYVSGDYTGGALWFSPGIEPDSEVVEELLQGCLFEADQPDAFAVFEQMDHYHPHYPHWYLPLLGVDPRHQSQGLGSVLLHAVLDKCDRDRLPAYLESSNPENIPFYQHHGFEVIGTIQAGKSPQIFPMLRQPNYSI
ncbi:MAG: GNAT family N-acetyltransferase [Cyanobacteria bacterium J06635_15]